jgi:hypothetical protein
MTNLTEHRGVGFSISELGEGRYRWKLHPKKPTPVPDVITLTKIESGEVSGTWDDAVAEARKAIDALLDNPGND